MMTEDEFSQGRRRPILRTNPNDGLTLEPTASQNDPGEKAYQCVIGR
jgi:hypothetical protein